MTPEDSGSPASPGVSGRRVVCACMRDNSYRKAIGDGALTVVGDKALTRNITAWMANSVFADLPPASNI